MRHLLLGLLTVATTIAAPSKGASPKLPTTKTCAAGAAEELPGLPSSRRSGANVIPHL